MDIQTDNLVEIWRGRLSAEDPWNGDETLRYTESLQEALDLTFRVLLPLLAPCDASVIRDVAFPDLQMIWHCDCLVETEAEPVEKLLKTNLERDMQEPVFQQFAVDVGTEASEDDAYWVFRVDKDIQDILLRTKYIQVSSFVGTAFRGYRVWHLKYQNGFEAIGLAARGGSILL